MPNRRTTTAHRAEEMIVRRSKGCPGAPCPVSRPAIRENRVVIIVLVVVVALFRAITGQAEHRRSVAASVAVVVAEAGITAALLCIGRKSSGRSCAEGEIVAALIGRLIGG